MLRTLRLLLPLLALAMLWPQPARAELSSDERAQLSEMMLAQIVKVHGRPKAPPRDQQVTQVFYTLAAHAGRSDVRYRVEVVESPEVNAYALPDGRIVFFTGLLEALPSEDLSPLAFVAAHEIAHVEHRHAERLFQQKLATMVLLRVLTRNSEDWVQLLGGFAYNMFSSGYSREMEAEADREAMALMRRGDYDAHGALVTLGMFREASRKSGGPRIFPTHPDPEDRYKDAVAWIKTNDPSSPLVLADTLDLLLQESRETDRVAQALWDRVRNQPQAPGGVDAEARAALLGLAENTRSMVGALERSLTVPHPQFGSLQSARVAWAASRPLLPLDPAGSAQAAELESRLTRVQEAFLLAATRNTERLAQLLWRESGARGGEAGKSLLGVAESSQRLRVGLQSGKPAPAMALQTVLSEGRRWLAADGPNHVPHARRAEALALAGELEALQGLHSATPATAPPAEHKDARVCTATLDRLAQTLWAQVRNMPLSPGDDAARRTLLGLAENGHNLAAGADVAEALSAVQTLGRSWDRQRHALALGPEQRLMAEGIAREVEHLVRLLPAK